MRTPDSEVVHFAGQAFPAEGVHSIQGSDLLPRDQPILDAVHERTTNLPWMPALSSRPAKADTGWSASANAPACP
jgi:hypothetical protein